ncbi:MAG: DUF3899 domain-containing protein [Acholeplasmataceae bacterium]|nr:DUF3899 domain-containing protein [Acholeplasmataceae bacterium]
MNESKNTKLNDKNKIKKIVKKYLTIVIVSIIVSLVLALFALSWQDSYTLLAYCNAFYFSGFILFFIGWIILMSNMNILSPLIYGLKTFVFMFAGKKQKLDYYEYLQEKKENPIPNIVLLTPMLASIPNFIVAIILHIML